MMKRHALALVLVLLLYPAVTPTLARGTQLRGGELISENQTFDVTFHRPVLNGQGQIIRVNNNPTYQVGPALSQGEIARGFTVGDRVVIRMIPPVDVYVYIVNNSQWDGATLLANGVRLTAGTTRDFVIRLTNPKNTQGEGYENFLFLIRRDMVPQAEVERHLVPSRGSQSSAREIRLDNTRDEMRRIADAYKEERTKGGKGRVVLKVGCAAARLFFPFVGAICQAASAMGAKGFTAGELENGDELKAEDDAENMVVQFSFPLRSR